MESEENYYIFTISSNSYMYIHMYLISFHSITTDDLFLSTFFLFSDITPALYFVYHLDYLSMDKHVIIFFALKPPQKLSLDSQGMSFSIFHPFSPCSNIIELLKRVLGSVF